jgi:hypothetical protein
MIGVDRHVRIAEEDFQRGLSIERISDRLGQRMFRLEIQALALRITPAPERTHRRFTVPGSRGLFVGSVELSVAYFRFSLGQRADQR